MLTCIPLVYAISLIGAVTPENRARTVRNPLVVGSLAYAGYLALGFMLGNSYPPDYQWGPAFRYFALDASLLPFSWACLLFVLFFHRAFHGRRKDLLMACRSFLAAFLFWLSIQDLVQSVSFLSPLDLWFLPLVRAIWFIFLSFFLSQWRAPRRVLLLLTMVLVLLQVATGFGLASAWLSLPVLAVLWLLIPIFLGAGLLLIPSRIIPPGWISEEA